MDRPLPYECIEEEIREIEFQIENEKIKQRDCGLKLEVLFPRLFGLRGALQRQKESDKCNPDYELYEGNS